MEKYKRKLFDIHFCLNFIMQLLIELITNVYNYKVANCYVIC